MSIESQPQDNKPNLEPQFDVMRRLLDEQAIHDGCDELDQISHMASVLTELNNELRDKAIRASVRVSTCGIEYEGDGYMIGAASKNGGEMTATGYIVAVNYGAFLETKGYMIHLIDPDARHVHPERPNDEPVRAQFIIPIPNIHGYEYLPIETPDQATA